jgi:hypothetical protein
LLNLHHLLFERPKRKAAAHHLQTKRGETQISLLFAALRTTAARTIARTPTVTIGACIGASRAARIVALTLNWFWNATSSLR